MFVGVTELDMSICVIPRGLLLPVSAVLFLNNSVYKPFFFFFLKTRSNYPFSVKAGKIINL